MTTQVATGNAKRQTPRAHKWVYDFAEGSREMRDLLGGKGAGIAEMTRVLGAELVPAGFTITTEACVAYMRGSGAWPAGLEKQVEAALARLEALAGKRLGDPEGSAAGLGSLGRARVDAGDDGHGAQLGPERRVGGRAGRPHRG